MSTKSTPETGHAMNLANMEDLTVRYTGFGGAYNPSRPELQLIYNLKV